MKPASHDLGRALAELLERITGVSDEAVALAARIVARETALGQVCVDLGEFAGRPVDPADPHAPWTPERGPWIDRLERHPAVGRPGDERPLVLDGAGRLYLHRYWEYERAVAEDVRRRAAAGRIEIVTGGPGTGKTTRVAEILQDAIDGGTSRIELAAPTGKAAARVQEALVQALDRKESSPSVRAAVPTRAKTLHRLLGARLGKARTARGPDSPLDVELLVVDEASMVGLALLAKTLGATPPDARVVLLGDRDQLASVDPGAVFADLCADGTVLAGAITALAHSYRFDAAGGIGALAAAVRERRADAAVARLREGGDALAWTETASSTDLTAVVERAASAGRPVLCAVREGPFGVAAINERFERRLRRAGALGRAEGPWYPGRPVMIVRNDPALGLFNGDLGVVERDAEGRLRVVFPAEGGGTRAIAPVRLPPHETAYAMTVHKSQGSEFDRVTVVLPPRPSPAATRELLYTAVTRARLGVEIVATEEAVRAAIATATRRVSGLRDALAPPHNTT